MILIAVFLGISIWIRKRRTTTQVFLLKSYFSSSMNVFLITLGFLALLTFFAHNISQDYYIFGTDKIGQEVFYAALKSIRTGLVLGTVTTLVVLPFALLLGAYAGYFGGLVDDVIQYVYTTLSSIPGVLLIAASVLALQIFIANHPSWFVTIAARADARLLALCFILGITSWTSLCRLLRGETLKLREMDYVHAAKALGVGHFKIILRHVLPNMMHIVLITVVLDFSGLVLAEAVLTYIGVGVDPSSYSWGNMINTARLELARDPVVWWPLLAAFCSMFLLVITTNLVADSVREAFDPRID
ncbi:MAG: ABC transporter permease [Gammaproteobacteria bacterium]